MEETGQPTAFEDPAAAFLAREQDQLAGIADDTLGIGTEVCDSRMLALRFGRGRLTFSLLPGRPRSCSNRRTVRRRKRFVWNSHGERYLKQQGSVVTSVHLVTVDLLLVLLALGIMDFSLFLAQTSEPPPPATQDLYTAISSMDQTTSEPECIRYSHYHSAL